MIAADCHMGSKVACGDCYFRPLQPGDVEAVAADMREADRRELKRWSGNSPLYELQNAVDLSEVVWVGCYRDGTPMSVFGGKHANALDETGVIWELSTNAVNGHRLAFAKASRRGMDLVMAALPDVGEFYNFVDAEYESAVKWIEWLGGQLSMDGGFRGRCGGTFKMFIIGNPHYGTEEL